MTTKVTVDGIRAQELGVRRPGRRNTRALLAALLGCLAWLPLSTAAEAVPYQIYKNGACAGSVCNIDFPVLPANRRLEVSNVSCYLRTSSDHDIYAMQLLLMQGASAQSAVTLVPMYTGEIGTTEIVYSSNNTVYAIARTGQRFRAYTELKAGTFKQFACHISGHMLP